MREERSITWNKEWEAIYRNYDSVKHAYEALHSALFQYHDQQLGQQLRQMVRDTAQPPHYVTTRPEAIYGLHYDIPATRDVLVRPFLLFTHIDQNRRMGEPGNVGYSLDPAIALLTKTLIDDEGRLSRLPQRWELKNMFDEYRRRDMASSDPGTFFTSGLRDERSRIPAQASRL